ncbi:rod-binding protein [Vibrio maritimus]|uniref:rod-binding protein n=1 Tax=Vibrio maritimus TaxID=990268 RepID=UPI004068F390
MIDSNALAIIAKDSVLDGFTTGEIKASVLLTPIEERSNSSTPLTFTDVVNHVERQSHTASSDIDSHIKADMGPSSHFYLDQNSLSKLKYDNSQQGLLAAAEQFEALFIQSMLKRMRVATEALSDENNPLSTKSSSLFQGMLDAQLAQSLSQQSHFGLAEMIYQQLASRVPMTGSHNVTPTLRHSNFDAIEALQSTKQLRGQR